MLQKKVFKERCEKRNEPNSEFDLKSCQFYFFQKALITF